MLIKLNLSNAAFFRVLKRGKDTLTLDVGDELEITVPKRLCEIVQPCVTVTPKGGLDGFTADKLYAAYSLSKDKYVLKDDLDRTCEVDAELFTLVQEGFAPPILSTICDKPKIRRLSLT